MSLKHKLMASGLTVESAKGFHIVIDELSADLGDDLGDDDFFDVDLNRRVTKFKSAGLKELAGKLKAFVKSRDGQFIDFDSGDLTFDTKEMTWKVEAQHSDGSKLSDDESEELGSFLGF